MSNRVPTPIAMVSPSREPSERTPRWHASSIYPCGVIADDEPDRRPQDLRNNAVLGTAIGGTWAQPPVVVGPPVKEDGDLVARCHRATVRLPLEAGVAVPRF